MPLYLFLFQVVFSLSRNSVKTMETLTKLNLRKQSILNLKEIF